MKVAPTSGKWINPMADIDIGRLRELLAKAGKTPWADDFGVTYDGTVRTVLLTYANHAVAVAAVNALPALLDAYTALTEEVAAQSALIDAWAQIALDISTYATHDNDCSSNLAGGAECCCRYSEFNRKLLTMADEEVKRQALASRPSDDWLGTVREGLKAAESILLQYDLSAHAAVIRALASLPEGGA